MKPIHLGPFQNFIITIILVWFINSDNPLVSKIAFCLLGIVLIILLYQFLKKKYIKSLIDNKIIPKIQKTYPDKNDIDILDFKFKKNQYTFTLLMEGKIYDLCSYSKKTDELIVKAE